LFISKCNQPRAHTADGATFKPITRTHSGPARYTLWGNQNAYFAAVTVIPVLLIASSLQRGRLERAFSQNWTKWMHGAFSLVAVAGTQVAFFGAILEGVEHPVAVWTVVMGFSFALGGILAEAIIGLFGSSTV